MLSIGTWEFVGMMLACVASGVILTIICIMFLDWITKSRVTGHKEPVTEQINLKDRYIQKLERENPKSASIPSLTDTEVASGIGVVRTSEGETVSISAVGKADLDKRAAQRRNYKVSEVAELLGVATSTINVWLGKGYLQSIVASDKTRWVTAASVVNLLDKLGVVPTQDADPIVAALSGPEIETEEKKLATVHQWYRYYVDGGEKPFTTLKEAVIAAGVRVPDGQSITWSNIGSVIRHRIKRVRL